MPTHGVTDIEWRKSRGQPTVTTRCCMLVPREPEYIDLQFPSCRACNDSILAELGVIAAEDQERKRLLSAARNP